MRRIPIEAPGAPPRPSPDPVSTVAVTDEAAPDAETESERFFPNGGDASALIPDSHPAAGMIVSVTGRRGAQVAYAERRSFVGRRKSTDSLRISIDDVRRARSIADVERGSAAKYGTVSYLGPPLR